MVYGESEYIYGIHASSAGDGWGSTGADLLQSKGWVCFTEAIGRSISDMTGRSYLPWTEQDLGVIVRLNHGYAPNGTIPKAAYYGDFATRCGNYVHSSQGCHIWIIGNEPNHSQERPQGEVITPYDYYRCYLLCRDEIHRVQGDAVVLMAGPAPWNWESGDFGMYWKMCLAEAAGDLDGVAIHTYTHGADPTLVTDNTKMNPPGQAYFWNFRVYRDLLEHVPDHTPIYITETNQEGPWTDTNSGWVEEAYKEINGWNQANLHKTIRALCLYRWTHDQWEFRDKAGVQADLLEAIEAGYKWTEGDPPMGDWIATYTNHCDDYHLWGSHPPIKVLDGWSLFWNPTKPRPEMDFKYDPQPEVYPADPPRSGVGFLPYAEFDWWMRTTNPITIKAGVRTRLSIPLMIVAHGMGGDPSKLGDCGMRFGFSGPDDTEITSPNIVWSEWRTVRDPNQPGANADEYVWYPDETPEIIPQIGQAHLWIRCVANVAADISAGHFDLIQVLHYEDSTPPPVPPGDCRGVTPEQVRQIVREELANLHLVLQ